MVWYLFRYITFVKVIQWLILSFFINITSLDIDSLCISIKRVEPRLYCMGVKNVDSVLVCTSVRRHSSDFHTKKLNQVAVYRQYFVGRSIPYYGGCRRFIFIPAYRAIEDLPYIYTSIVKVYMINFYTKIRGRTIH